MLFNAEQRKRTRSAFLAWKAMFKYLYLCSSTLLQQHNYMYSRAKYDGVINPTRALMMQRFYPELIACNATVKLLRCWVKEEIASSKLSDPVKLERYQDILNYLISVL